MADKAIDSRHAKTKAETQRETDKRQPKSETKAEAPDLLGAQRAAIGVREATPAQIIALQHIGGNRAVSRLTEADRIHIHRSPARPDAGFQAGEAREERLAANRGAGSPLPAEVRAFMEPRFGANFSGVRVHTDGEAAQLNRQVSAQAFTRAQDIYMGEGKYQPESRDGKRLLAHELTHVVQQTSIGRPRIQRWSISTFATKYGHETITHDSVAQYNEMAEKNNADPKNKHMNLISKADEKQLVKGARWNDMLGHWGIITMGLALLKGGTMTHESHEGQLQFLHGMASNLSESVWRTQHKIMLWAEFCYKVGTGEISGDTLIKDVKVSSRTDFGETDSIAALFGKWGGKTVAWLFTEDKSSSIVGQRALGSMMHMLQDTFCASHAQRVAARLAGQEASPLKGFNVYTEQSASAVGSKIRFNKWKNRHAIADNLRDKGKTSANTAGAKEAANIGAKVLALYAARAPWDGAGGAREYLEKVFDLAKELKEKKREALAKAPSTGAPQAPSRLTSASGRLFRKDWLADKFKDESSVSWSRRPPDLKPIDDFLKLYTTFMKDELNNINDPDLTLRLRLIGMSYDAATLAKENAEKYRNAHPEAASDKDQKKRNDAVKNLLTLLNEDLIEMKLDIDAAEAAQKEQTANLEQAR